MTRRHHWKGIAIRLVPLTIPAFYCSWIACRVSRKLERFTLSTIHKYDDAPFLQHVLSTEEVNAKAAERLQTSCFPHNTIDWLNSTRHGNADGDFFLDGGILSTISLPQSSGQLRSMLQETLCYENSSLLSFANGGIMSSDESREVRMWTIRLIYWVVYEHQYSPALPEALSRLDLDSPCWQSARAKGVATLDFECPSAKFLVVSFYKNGIGANLRLGAVPALEAGIASGRVVLFVDDADEGPSFLQEPWPLASCDHRRDSQCFFRPASPCVVTTNELASARVLTRGEMRHLFRAGRVPEHYAEDRVLILHLNFRPQRQPENLAGILYNRSVALIERLATNDNGISRKLLFRAAEAILTEEQVFPTYNYYGAGSAIFHSLLLYASRPNRQAAWAVNSILRNVLPTADAFSSQHALGLPIRGMSRDDRQYQNCLLDSHFALLVIRRIGQMRH
jgi:hypothetical protein